MPADIFELHKIKREEVGYPVSLNDLSSPPEVLYFKGDISLLSTRKCISIVGSRNMSTYGNSALIRIFSKLCYSKIAVVSGFTRGVDTAAHILALQNGVPTVAVLPCGLNCPFTSIQQKLMTKVLNANGLIISEYPPAQNALPWMFIKRNRLVACLSQVLVVVEASAQSGTLSTFKFAQKLHRRVLAIPGDIFSENMSGVCQMFQSGAKPLVSGLQINKALEISNSDVQTNINFPSDASHTIYDLLCQKGQNRVELLASSHLSVYDFNTALSYLTLNGYIFESQGYYYVSQN